MVLCGASLLALGSATRTARADEKAQCVDAAGQAQSLRDAHKLLEAREQLRVCAQQTCPAAVQKDCSTWLSEVEGSLPTVVISAKDGAGKDVFDFTVTLDGQAAPSNAAGEAFPIDPGPHTFVFQTKDGASVEQKVLVREGIRNQPVTVVLGGAQPGAGATPATSTGGAPSPGGASPPGAGTSSGPPLRMIGWVAGGAGVLGLGIGTVFGLVAIGDKNGVSCNADGVCPPGSLGGARTAATVSTVGFIAGGVLLAGGAALVLLGHPSEPQVQTGRRSRLELAPLVGTREAGVQLGGAW
jgi:hypothetical protein